MISIYMKTVKVIRSCQTLEQFDVALKYVAQALDCVKDVEAVQSFNEEIGRKFKELSE